jgi:restriction endonuclease Mrr
MLPLLKFAGDGKTHTIAEARDKLSVILSIDPKDRVEMLPSGSQSRFDNRVTWARTYLSKAGLLTRLGRGSFKITDQGRSVLLKPPPRIDKKFLRSFPDFVKFADDWKSNLANPATPPTPATIDDVGDERTPIETLEASYKRLRSALATDLLDQLAKTTPKFFEQVVIDLLLAMGYGGSRADAAQIVGKSGDEGIDGTIKEDKLGLDVVYVQAKRWNGSVSRPNVQSFAGSLDGKRARRGAFIQKGGTLSQPLVKPSKGPPGPSGFALSDDFSTNRFGVQWSFFNPGVDEIKRARYEARALAISGKGKTLADCSPLTFLIGDRSYEAEITLDIGDDAQAGICLFYSEGMFCGIGFSKTQMFTYNYGQEHSWMRQPMSTQTVRLRVTNHANIVTFYYSRNDQDWIKHPWQMEVSGYHHNVLGGFLSLKFGVYCIGTGEAKLRAFVYRASLH